MQTVKVELKEGGSDIPVTKHNRQEFVNLFVDWCAPICSTTCGPGADLVFVPVHLLALDGVAQLHGVDGVDRLAGKAAHACCVTVHSTLYSKVEYI